ncbi:unnamed protein product [Cladocopium goreaui]|uniref:DNA/RNA-binding protein Alba-like domain-containing protein n=1 Tax=Cladocopium goreaui TaxID=2562237 RepID=A0A9P1GNH3_9DINO|nr:unnamed protein product [Cladocopium goreaui]
MRAGSRERRRSRGFRSLLMDKYRKEDIQKSDEEIRVTAAGSVSVGALREAYVSRAATVFNELKKPYVIVQATGNALTKAVTAAEAHQIILIKLLGEQHGISEHCYST